MVTTIKGTKGTHGTNGAAPTVGGIGQNETFTQNGQIVAGDPTSYLIQGGDGGLGGDSTVGNGAAGGKGGNASATVNGNIFNSPATTTFTLSITSQGGDGGLGGAAAPTFVTGIQGNGGNATTKISGNIVQPSMAMGAIELDAIAIGGQGPTDGNASATLSGNIVQVSTATSVTLDALATVNDPTDSTFGGANFGTKTANVTGNVVQGAVTTVRLAADAKFANSSAILSGNIVNDTATSGNVILEATGQHIDIENNKVVIGKGQELDFTVNALAPAYIGTFPSFDTTIKGNEFTGASTNNTFVFTDNGYSGGVPLVPASAVTPDTIAIDLGADTFVFDGQSNKLTNFNNATVSGNNAASLTGDATANILIGGSGNDLLTGGAGNDTIDGGAGNFDTAMYSGTRSQYTIALSQTGTLAGTVTDTVAGRDGTDTLQNVEFLKFSDGLYDVVLGTFTPNSSLNHAPAGADKTITTLEDTSYTFAAADFGFSDPNDVPANALLAVKIDTLPAAGTLTDNGVAVTAGQSVTVADINAGLLKFAPAANANGASYANFTFQVQDNGGTAGGGVDLDQSPNTITFNVTSVNDAPAGADKTVATPLNTPYIFAVSDFGFTDSNDSPANNFLDVKIDALPAAGTLTDNGVAVTAGQFVTVADIAAGKLQFAPAVGGTGANYANFTFQVQDDGGTANGGVDTDQSPNTITFNVGTTVNIAPAGADKTITTLEDTSYTFAAADFGFTDPGNAPPNALLAVKIDTLPAAGTLTDNGVAVTAGQFVTVADINSGLLKFAPAANANGNSYSNFTFQVQDNGGTAGGGVDLDQSPNTITFNVTPVNDAPLGANKTITTLEDTSYTFAAADFGFTDPNDSPANALLAVKIDTLPVAGTLTDNGVAVTAGQSVTVADITAGLLKFAPAANANGASYANFTFQVRDNGGTANGGVDTSVAPNTITFNVTSVNDAPLGGNKTITTLEDTSYTFAAADFGFIDPNDVPANALLAVKIDSLPAAGSLTDNGVAVTAGQSVTVADITAGLLKFAPAANANGASYANFTFQVQDNGGTANGGVDTSITPNTITFNVTSVNDAPAGADKTVSTSVNTPYIFTVSDFGFTDPNDSPANNFLDVKIDTLPAAGTLTDNGVAVTAGQFVTVADITAGKLQFAPAVGGQGANYANFTFQVQDDGGTANGGVDTDQSPNTITFNVGTVNVAPAGTDKTITTLEDTSYTFAAADFGFTDPGNAPPNALLAVKIDTLPAAGTLTDNGVAVTAGQFVTVADINSGLLKFAPAANANGNSYANFAFQVQDNGGTAGGGVDLDQSPNTITFNVTSVNDAPLAANKTITTLEDTSYTFAAADFGFSDPNDVPANALLAVKIDTLPVAGTLTDNGVAVTAGQSVTVADIAAGLLKFAPAANANGASYANFTFQVQDNGGTANGGVDTSVTPNTITFNVTSVNDAPLGANKTITTLEDTSYTFAAADFGFTDPNDVPANALLAVKIDSLPAAGTLTDNGVAVTAGQSVTVADITAGLLKFAPAANANGNSYANFTFQVQDNGGTANGGVDTSVTPNTISFNVTSVNDAPLAANKTITTLEDTSYTFAATDFGFSDPNDTPANALLAVKIDSLPAAGTLTDNGVAITAGQSVTVADITAGLLKFAPAANANGASYANFTFQVQDNGGTANGGVDTSVAPNTITFNVTSVNDAPLGANKTITTLEDTSYTFAAADFGFTDPNDVPANALLAVKIDSLPIAGTLTDNGVAVTAGQSVAVADITAGLLKFAPAANGNGNSYANFTFQVQDNGGTANGGADTSVTPNSITFNVTSVNDAPVAANKTITTLEDTSYTFAAADFGFSDPNDVPANALLAVKIDTLPAAGTLTDNGVAVTAGQSVTVADITAGLLKFAPAANANGASYANFTFQVQDNGGTANGGIDTSVTPNTITFNVTPVNDAPAGADKIVTTLEDTSYTFAASDFGFSDPNDVPANALLAVKISTLPAAGTLTDNGVAVTAGQFVSVADINSGLLKFAPGANANGNLYASFTFQVQDNGGTANGGIDLDQSPNTISFNVTPVNDAPTGANNTITAAENGLYTFTAADFGFSDPNDTPSNSLLRVEITTLPLQGTLTDNGVLVTAGQFISVAEINAGFLKFQPVTNTNGNGYTNFTFQVQDDGGTANGGVDTDPTPKTITFNVMPTGAGQTFNGTPGNDNLLGTAGNDTFIASTGKDTINGGAGSDTLVFNHSSGPLIVDLGNSGPQFIIGYGTDKLLNLENIDTSATSTNNILTGNASNNTLIGGSGDDTFVASAGNDTYIGNAGSNTIDLGNAAGGVTLSLTDPNPHDLTASGLGIITLSGIENINGSDFGDTLTGDANANIITGGAGNDTINGAGGNDLIIASGGNDTLDGGTGINTIDFRNATSGVTVSLGAAGAQTVGGGLGNDTLSNFQNLTGSSYNDVLTGDANNNTILGMDGDDTIFVTPGQDTLDGGTGNNTADFSNYGFGVNVTTGSAVAQALNGADSVQLLSIQNLTGTAFDDTLTGGTGNNILLGGAGNDTLTGGGGALDIYNGGIGNDTVNGANGTTDLAQFAGLETQYALGGTLGNGNTATFGGGPDGTDTLNNVDRVKFLSPSHVSDVDNDGFGDLVFQNKSTGAIQVNTNSAGTINGGNILTASPPDNSWNAIGTGQFTPDAAGTAARASGILVQQTGTGQMSITTGISGAASTSTPITASAGTFTGWTALTTGDFNGDGASDVLLSNGGGGLEIAFLNGTVGAPVGTLDSIQSVATPPGFSVVSSGDFNGDGFSDILLKDGAGDVQVDLMRGSTVESSAVLAAPGLTAIGSGDFNGDGKSDILFSNATGDAVIWTMNGTSQTGAFAAQTKPSAGYSLMGAADINGDGISDLLWQNGTNVYVTLEDGAGNALAGSGLLNNIVPANSFHLLASTGGG